MRKGLNRRQRAVLDLVCGQSFRLREAAQQLHAGPATLTALIVGLKVAEEQAGGAGKARAEWRRADRGSGPGGECDVARGEGLIMTNAPYFHSALHVAELHEEVETIDMQPIIRTVQKGRPWPPMDSRPKGQR